MTCNETNATCSSAGCSLPLSYSWLLASIAVVAILLSFLLLTVGYRLFRATFVLVGLVPTSLTVYLVVTHAATLPLYADILITSGSGILVGVVCILVPHVALVFCGLDFGIISSLLIISVIGLFVDISFIWLPVLVVGVVAISCAIIAVRFQKTMLILGSCALGASLLVSGIDYFISLWRTLHYVWTQLWPMSAEEPCWYGWCLLALVPVLTFITALIQFKFTGRKTDHRPAMYPCGRKPGFEKVELREKSVTTTERAPPPEADHASTRYRHLYQVRRSNGDVISQQYIQSVQHKMSPAVRSMTSLNSPSSTHASTERHVTNSSERQNSAERNQSTNMSSLTAVTHIPEVMDESAES